VGSIVYQCPDHPVAHQHTAQPARTIHHREFELRRTNQRLHGIR
jgi:hypothetical protein